MRTDFKGLIAATFTPFGDEGEILYHLIEPVVESLIAQGVSGIFVCGSTGEGFSLTTQERMAVTEAFIQAAKGRLSVFVQIGHYCLKDMYELAKHAVDKGADALSAAMPTYYGIESELHLAKVLATVLREFSSTPFFYYHIPSKTGLNLDMKEFLKVGQDLIPSLAGVKYTAPTLHELQDCLETFDQQFQFGFGMDEMFLASLFIGTNIWVGSTYNFMPEIYQQIWNAYQSGDLEKAKAWQYKAVQVINLLKGYNSIAGQKAMMNYVGLDCGRARLPIQNLSAAGESRFKNELDKLGILSGKA